jgi:hypothetical protein
MKESLNSYDFRTSFSTGRQTAGASENGVRLKHKNLRRTMMRSRLIRYLFLFLLLSFSAVSIAYGIDTKDWEGVLVIQLFSAKPDKDWLSTTTLLILADAFPIKDEKYFDKYFDKESNSINVPIQNGWHDLTEFRASYSESKQGGYIYAVRYKFRKGAITLLDVLDRYGYELADIETKEDLSKEITYVLKKEAPSLIGKNPIWSLRPLNQGQVTILKFASKDKVFINDLIIFTHKNEN